MIERAPFSFSVIAVPVTITFSFLWRLFNNRLSQRSWLWLKLILVGVSKNRGWMNWEVRGLFVLVTIANVDLNGFALVVKIV